MMRRFKGLSWQGVRGPAEQPVPSETPQAGQNYGRGLTLPAQRDAGGKASLWVPHLGGTSGEQVFRPKPQVVLSPSLNPSWWAKFS